MKTIAVLDYGSGNVRSVVRAAEKTGAKVVLTADPSQTYEADGLIVPGVGAFAACMSGLKAVGGDEIIAHRIQSARPVLGICVGMQICFEYGIEHGERSSGLSLLPGGITAVQADVTPHMGWNLVEAAAGSAMFASIETERFYFVHSYAAHGQPDQFDRGIKISYAHYGGDTFLAAVERDALWATQFHPEKSGHAGARLLQNWTGTL